MNILLVEDNPGDARLVELALTEGAGRDVTVTHVLRLSDATARLAVDPFDAILLDLSLPDSQGLATVERINEAAPNIPVVVLTGLNDDAVALAALNAGAQDFLPKGTAGAGLMRSLRFAIERRKAAEATQGAERHYRDLFDEAPVLYAITRREPSGPVVVDCNELFLRSLGYAREEVIGRPIANFYAPAPRLAGDNLVLVDLELNRVESVGERRLLARDGTVIETAVRLQPEYAADGSVSGARATFADITVLKQTETALRLAKEIAEYARAEAEKARADAEEAHRRTTERYAELEAELQRAAEMQARLLPQTSLDLAGYELAGICLPARQVGGDFFDWTAEQGVVRLMLGDVMGKGMAASLLTATVRAALRSVNQLPVEVAVETVSRALTPDLIRSDSFITLFYTNLDSATGVLTYIDAGHGLVFVQRRTGDIEPLRQRGLPIGVLPDTSYPAGTMNLDPGDTLVVFSDGLTDAHPDLRLDPAGVGRQIGDLPTVQAKLERLVSLVNDIDTRPDDMTLLLLHRREDG